MKIRSRNLHPRRGRSGRLPAALVAAATASAAFGGDGLDPLIPDQVILKLAEDASLEAVVQELAPVAPGIHAADEIPGRRIHQLRFELQDGAPPDGLEPALAGMVAAGTLIWSEFGYQAQTGEGRTDSLWVTGLDLGADQYHGQFVRELLGLQAAHALTRGSGVVVAVLDTGLDLTHPLIEGPISAAALDLVDGLPSITDPTDGIDNDADGLVDEMAGHGTFVASLVHLVAPEATLLPIRILDTEGRTDIFLMAKGIAAAIDGGAQVINMSLGSTYKSVAVEDLTDEAAHSGVVVVASIGNLDRDAPEEYPAADNGAFGVVATGPADLRAPFSNYGDFAAISAPGTVALAGKAGVDPNLSVLGAIPGGGVGGWAGTSFSTALVSAAAALVRAAHPEWPNAAVPLSDLADAVMEPLLLHAVPIDAINPGFEGLLGAGRLDVAASIKASPPQNPADLDGDGSVDGVDLTIVLAAWGPCNNCPADIDGNGMVDGVDLTEVLAGWTG